MQGERTSPLRLISIQIRKIQRDRTSDSRIERLDLTAHGKLQDDIAFGTRELTDALPLASDDN